ncbi:MAG: hypothetical protein FJX91_04705 [Bacteroidetes bacterium]|nr:hypothetical protein [Bacteroidota bacterium]
MKLQSYINDFKGEFHGLHGKTLGLTESQSEVYVDLTVQSALQYMQTLMMSGKIKELQTLMGGGAEALQNSEYYQRLIDQCVSSYYGLDWETDRKKNLAVHILGFVLAGLKAKFEEGGHPSTPRGVMQFLGIDLGILGKMGGLFGKWF